jgi:hypothetical protein
VQIPKRSILKLVKKWWITGSVCGAKKLLKRNALTYKNV